MFAARNQLLASRKHGTVAFDAASANFSPSLGSAGSPFTWTHTVATAGATIYVDIMCDRAVTLSPVTAAGNNMTLLNTITYPTIGGLVPFYVRYKFTGAAAGANTISVTPSAASWIAYGSASYTGVGSEGAVQTSSGTGATGTQSPTCGSGQMILQGVSGSYNGSTSMSGSPTVSGGNSRCYSTSALYDFIGMSDTATSGTTFTWSQPGLAYWRGMAHALIPA